ncbi:MAG: glycosyltransferase family 2 protein [Bacteroidia bacterium]|nr:glycosyltransferase family 2 protein [Bacteroidia bacterium]
MNITIGIPAFNEEKNIGKVIISLKKIVNDIIVCDDGSTDLTKEIAEGLGAKVISHKKNMGYGEAIKSIFNEAKKNETDILVTFDADGQHRSEDIKNLTKPILDQQAEMVIGSRFLKNETDMPNYRKIGIKVLTKVTNMSIKENLTDSQSGLRAYHKKVLQNINLTDSGMGISTEILIKSHQNKFRIIEVPIKILYGKDTSTHNPISHGTSVLLSTIKYTSIQHPLKFYGISGIVLLLVGLSFLLWTLQIYAEETRVVTNIALIGIGTLILGAILMISGILLYSLVSVVRENRNT